MRLLRTSLIICIGTLSMTGCLHPLRMPEDDLLAPSRIVRTLEAQRSARQRLSGRYQARATGIKQFLGRVDLTVALQLPSSFYISIPSFFGMPARVVTSDGNHLYLLDLSGPNPIYAIEPNNSEVVERWLGFRIEPREFVSALLGVVDMQNATLVDSGLTRRNTRYQVKIRHLDDKRTELEFDSDSDDLLSLRVLGENGLQLYKVDYSDFRDTNSVRFPWQTKISVHGKENDLQLLLSGDELDFDDSAFEDSTFQIEEP